MTRKLLTAAILLLSLGATMPASAQPGRTPVEGPTEVKTRLLPDIPVHDPWILTHEPTRTYYLYTAGIPRETGLDRYGTVVYKSRDLERWDGPYVVFQIPDGGWADPMHGAWAPEVHEYRGRYYLFVTLHNRNRIIDQPPDTWRVTHMRGSVVAVSDSPEGPFRLLQDRPHPPADFMTLDGTLFVDEQGTPWMVYAHEWIQVIDGTLEAIRMKPDLSSAVGEPIHLFKASDAPWLNPQARPSKRERSYVTDGPQLYRTRTGSLVMLWSSYGDGGYIQTQAVSESGRLQGPWRQLEPLVGNDSGHGMPFRTFDGRLMLVLHRPFAYPASRARLYELDDSGDALRIVREHTGPSRPER